MANFQVERQSSSLTSTPTLNISAIGVDADSKLLFTKDDSGNVVVYGPQASTPTVAVGATITGAPGTDASVVNLGTDTAAVFQFTVPQGADGADGQAGPAGANGTSVRYLGSVQEIADLPALGNTIGDSYVVIANGDLYQWDGNAWLDVGQWVGPQGPQGQAASVAVGTVTSVPYGSGSSVVNMGTATSAIFDFTLESGPQGIQGIQGIPGIGINPKGEVATLADLPTSNVQGDTYLVTETGNWYVWSADNTWIDAGQIVGPQGPAGQDGAVGATGPAGTAATIAIGTVTTLGPGEEATVTNSGTTSAAIFDFAIPEGMPGAVGAPGDAATIAIGTVQTVPYGSPATVTNTGSSNDAIFNFQIPAGQNGLNGMPGEPGMTPQVSVGTVSTVPYGTGSSVTDSGVAPDVVLNFTLEAGPQGVAGTNGINGVNGEPGMSATVSVGSTQTGAPGSSAIVTNSGTMTDAILDFIIPRGDVGATGPAGQNGANGQDGAAATIVVGTVSSVPSGDPATVTNSGTSTNAIFDFEIPVGATGATGATGANGADGAAATIAVGTVTTGAAGSPASVTNVGSSSAAVFDFSIPQGAKGDTGDTGPAGPSGVVAATAPLSYASETQTVSIAQASALADGYLSSADWSTFNAKQASLGTGTSTQFLNGQLQWVSVPGASIAQVLTVGVDASTIQGCINLATDANHNKYYVVRIPPGQYTEDLTFHGCVNLQGMGNEQDTDTVVIFGNHTYNGTNGNALNNRFSVENINFSDSSTDPIFTFTATNASQISFTGCFIMNYNTSTSVKLFSIGVNVKLYLYNNTLRMSGTDNTGGTHVFFASAGELYAPYGLNADGGTCFLDMSTGGYAQLTNGTAAVKGTSCVVVGYAVGGAGGFCVAQSFGFTNLHAGGNGITLLSNGSTLFGTMATAMCSFTVTNNAAGYVVTGAAPSYFFYANNQYSNSAAAAYNVKIKNTVTALPYTTTLTSSP